MLTRREGITGLEGAGRDSSATLGMTWGIPQVGRGRPRFLGYARNDMGYL